jgi:hypothetical protein
MNAYTANSCRYRRAAPGATRGEEGLQRSHHIGSPATSSASFFSRAKARGRCRCSAPRVEAVHGGLVETPIGQDLRQRASVDRAGAVQPVCGGFVVEKMHLWPLAFEGENSIVASQ